MGTLLLWLAEATGSALLKALVERWFGKPKPASDPTIVAEASRADAKAAQSEQIAQAASDRAKVDQQVIERGADAARDDMATHWNDPS